MTNREISSQKQTGIQPQSTLSPGNLYVIRRDDGWVVYRANKGDLQELARATSQREAIERSRSLAANQNVEIIIHNRNDQRVGREIFRDHDWELEVIPRASNTPLSDYIDTVFYGERPHIRGRRVLVSMIAANARANGWTASRLAHEFSLSEEEVLAALLYAHEHQLEIDQQDQDEQRRFDELFEQQRK